jgi:transcriptional regulator with XRE-family HTH domain
MPKYMTVAEWEAELGRHLRGIRLRQDLDQIELARRSGMALNAVKHLESGRGATVKSLIRVLRTLGREEWLNTLAPPVSISPMQLLRSAAPRQRVSRRRKKPR